MDSSKLNEWLQVVGLFGVVASLLFVGMQMQQDHAIARSAASQARTDTTVQQLQDMASNPYYMSAIDKASSDQELLPSEFVARTLTNRATLFIFENIHYQYSNGFIEEERWLGTRDNVKLAFENRASLREFYQARPSLMRESFQVVLDDLIAEIDAERSAQ